MANLVTSNWEAVKWLLRYLKGTSSMAMCFKNANMGLEGFVDAELGGDSESQIVKRVLSVMFSRHVGRCGYKLDVKIANTSGTLYNRSGVYCNFGGRERIKVAELYTDN